MKSLGQFDVWVVTGSQHLYGEDTLRMDEHARRIAEALDGHGIIYPAAAVRAAPVYRLTALSFGYPVREDKLRPIGPTPQQTVEANAWSPGERRTTIGGEGIDRERTHPAMVVARKLLHVDELASDLQRDGPMRMGGAESSGGAG